jgi:hypothetical protein
MKTNMKALLILALTCASVSAFSAEKTVSYADPAKTVQISFTIQSENETEAVIVTPKIEFNSKSYDMYGGSGTGDTLCKALGYQSGQVILVQKIEVGRKPELIMIDIQGSISRVFDRLVLHTAICAK